MAQRSPTLFGFRAVLRTPSLWLAEVAWRWTFGIAAGLLLLLSAFEFLGSVEVPESDLLFLQPKHPLLLLAALSDILHGRGSQLLRVMAVLIPAFAVLWMFAAALGRTATLKVLLPGTKPRFRALLGLGFLRAASTLAALLAFFGAAILADVAGVNASYRTAGPGTPASQAILAAALVVLIAFLWAVLNWVLSLAAVLAARDHADTMSGISEALSLYGRRARDFWAASILFGLLHGLAALGAVFAAGVSLMLAGASPIAGLVALVAVVAIYLAVADFLHIARLAAYVAIAEDDHLVPNAGSPATIPPDAPALATGP